MKTPEEMIKRGEGNFLHCTDYEDAIEAMKEHSQLTAVKFLEWTLTNGWRKYDICEFSNGKERKTSNELYKLFISAS